VGGRILSTIMQSHYNRVGFAGGGRGDKRIIDSHNEALSFEVKQYLLKTNSLTPQSALRPRSNLDLDQSGVSEKLRANHYPNLRNPHGGKVSQNQNSEIPSVDSTVLSRA